MNATVVEEKLDPEIAVALKEQTQRYGAPIELTDLPPAEARPLFLKRNEMFNSGARPSTTRDFTIPTRAGKVAAREYRAPGATGSGAILYFHGGGWTFGSIDSHDALQRGLAAMSGDVVISVDYRLAPEHPFPAPLEDCVDAFTWCAENAASLGIDAKRIAVGGDSAGGNLALATALALRGGAHTPAAMLLYYGCFQTKTDTPSHRRFGDGRFGLSTLRMTRFWKNYIGADLKSSPLATPLSADYKGLPPAYLMVGALDILHDDTTEAAAKFKQAGVRHEMNIHPGCHHGFLHMVDRAKAAREAVEKSVSFWKSVRG
jgi:acetyl esterase